MKYRSQSLIALFLVILLAVPIISAASPDLLVSETERRPLAQFMDYSQYLGTHYGVDLADYLAYLETCLLDQFPYRDRLRALNSIARYYSLGQRDVNLYYKSGGHLGKLDPLLQEKALERALTLFGKVSSETFDGQGKHLFALIPDKNVFMADEGAYPHYTYKEIYDLVASQLDEKTGILGLVHILSLDDYYRTDPHWNQTRLHKLAAYILDALGRPEPDSESYQEIEGLRDYLGTYAGQAALPVEPDRLTWLTSPILDRLALYDPVSGEKTGVYQTDKLQGMDPYDFFMGGAKPLLVIENDLAGDGRQLVVFRDSFGSSLIPLLAGSYQRVVVIDLRYITMEAARSLVSIDPSSDVLHLYSTSVLNSPGAFLGYAK